MNDQDKSREQLIADQLIETTKMHNSLEGMRVLIVEDNLISQRLMHHIINQWNVSTDVAWNGKIAVEMVSENNYDVVLMDVYMPIMNGYEATRLIRSMEGEYFRNLPIIIFSNSPDIGKIRECGGTDFFWGTGLLREELYTVLSRYMK